MVSICAGHIDLDAFAGLALLLTPVHAEIGDSPAALQSAWHEMQTQASRDERGDWWQRLEPDELGAFLAAGVDVNIVDRRGWTPLHSAARYSRDPGCVRLLLDAGASVSAKDRAGDTPLHWAAAENPEVAVLSALLAAGADVNARDRFGWTPIHTAAETNPEPAVIRALLDAGANANSRAYFLLFSPEFLLKHNANMSGADRERAMAALVD